MAIYHCSVQVIGRNVGRSSVAAAAYRAGEKLVNEYDGIEHDFTKKNWVEYKEIILPDNAPPEYKDRSTLWNAVEMSEKSKDAQLCREFELALPIELTREQQIEVARQFAEEKLVSQGMMVDIVVHNPPVMNDRHQPIDQNGNPTRDISKMQFINPHSHIMATMRPIDEKGKWVPKSKTEYLCIKEGEEKGFTAEEYKLAKEQGWEKQYKYIEGTKKIWLPASEGTERELERVNRSPKTTPYGRKNEQIAYWDSRDRILEWREHWAKVVNDKFASINSETRIDHRSFKDQGREDELPTLHMGPASTNMERRADREVREGKPESMVVRSDIGNINREIKEHNRFVRQLREKIDAVVEAAKNLVDEIARKLEGIRAKIIGNNYEETVLLLRAKRVKDALLPEKERLQNYQHEASKVSAANGEAVREIKKLKKELIACSALQFAKKRHLQDRIQQLQEQIEYRNEYLKSVELKYGFYTAESFEDAKARYEFDVNGYAKLKDAVKDVQCDTKQLSDEYKTALAQTDPSIVEKVIEQQIAIRSDMEQVTNDRLKMKYGDDFEEDRYKRAREDANKELPWIKSTDSKGYMVHENDKNYDRGKDNPEKKRGRRH